MERDFGVGTGPVWRTISAGTIFALRALNEMGLVTSLAPALRVTTGQGNCRSGGWTSCRPCTSRSFLICPGGAVAAGGDHRELTGALGGGAEGTYPTPGGPGGRQSLPGSRRELPRLFRHYNITLALKNTHRPVVNTAVSRGPVQGWTEAESFNPWQIAP